MMQWDALVRAVRQEQPACRVAVVDGPAPLLGTRLVVGPSADDALPALELTADATGLAREALADGRPRLAQVGELRIYAEPVLPPPRLIVAGGGHVALALAPAALAAGFRVTVIDDRPDFARPERFPGCTVMCGEPPVVLAELRPDATTFIVLAGRTHEKDKEALRASVQLPSAYLGMMGSRRKVMTLQKELLEGGEATPWAMEKLRAPIGLDIGAETPAEIAVAIVAELIAVRRGGSGVPLARTPGAPGGGGAPVAREGGVPAGTVEGQQVWAALAEAIGRGEPCALATILAVRGSTPRSAGACMLVRADGSTVGSVGGGKWESEIRRLAIQTIAQNRPTLFQPHYLDESDMICGGSAEVFIEPIPGRNA
ncbi:MAG TPA: XdhC/CoxI family protein [Symbiobacteriaceae bacterium]|nr:XdhC/CoxI family protein [Symbiobacteriaceae bacterium]